MRKRNRRFFSFGAHFPADEQQNSMWKRCFSAFNYISIIGNGDGGWDASASNSNSGNARNNWKLIEALTQISHFCHLANEWLVNHRRMMVQL